MVFGSRNSEPVTIMVSAPAEGAAAAVFDTGAATAFARMDRLVVVLLTVDLAGALAALAGIVDVSGDETVCACASLTKCNRAIQAVAPINPVASPRFRRFDGATIPQSAAALFVSRSSGVIRHSVKVGYFATKIVTTFPFRNGVSLMPARQVTYLLHSLATAVQQCHTTRCVPSCTINKQNQSLK